jgi:hypothetical protein|tara:strand:+ start:143 stop:571 length:429 start_codon:yes stop_codon:yes gene_type:complete
MAGLATPIRKENDVLTATRKAFGKLDRKQAPLEERLQRLSEQDLYLVLQTASFVKMAHGFGERSDEPYIQLVREMYPKVSYNLQNIIAEVLQDAEPIEAKPKPNRRDEIISETIKEYEGIEDPDDKAERIQAAVLEKLKLND